MKKLIIILLTMVMCYGYSPMCVKAYQEPKIATVGITTENSPELWKKFLKYDLCITDYNSLTDDEKELCKFIFETELNSEDTIICERARRILNGYDVGERITLDSFMEISCVQDKIFICYDGINEYYNSLNVVPDVKHIDDNPKTYYEYWLDNLGTEKIIYTHKDTSHTCYRYEVYESNRLIRYTNLNTKVVEPEVISDDVFKYFKFSNNTLYVNYPIDTMSEIYEVPTEVDGMKVIGIVTKAFNDCRNCKEIILPDTIEYIESEAFSGCQNLEKIDIPNGVKAIGQMIFYGCKNLKDVTIDTPNAMVSYRAFEGSYVENIHLNFKTVDSEVLKTLKYYIRNVTFGNDVVKIGSSFIDTDITEKINIVIPDTVEVIADDCYVGTLSYEPPPTIPIKNVSVPHNIKIFGAYRFPAAGTETIDFLGEYKNIPAYISCTEDSSCEYYYKFKKFNISGYYGTEAHSYAVSNNLKFTPLDELNYGDTNGDEKINIADAVSLQKYLFGNGSVGYEADVNKDGYVDIFDMVEMRKMILNNQ
ncbi:MAG: leucine-rich repeat protein [Ruminococcus flavefaciens]|nr:leucine-rich repeat protein [Ruminococcus flavefaciens]